MHKSSFVSLQIRDGILDTMVEKSKALPEYEILISIPSIAETTATSIIGELGEVRHFQTPNQINAFIGIDLRHYESGNYLAQEHITKRGNPYARKILFKTIHNNFAASRFQPCHIADFYEKRKKQLCKASMHRLIRNLRLHLSQKLVSLERKVILTPYFELWGDKVILLYNFPKKDRP